MLFAAVENEGAEMQPDEQHTYTADSWENDPFLDPSPERDARVAQALFPMWQSLGLKTSQIKDPDQKAAYTAFLKKAQAQV